MTITHYALDLTIQGHPVPARPVLVPSTTLTLPYMDPPQRCSNLFIMKHVVRLSNRQLASYWNASLSYWVFSA